MDRSELFLFFFFNDPPPTKISPLPLHDPLPIYDSAPLCRISTNHFSDPLGSAARRLVADLAEPRLEHGRDDRLVDRRIQLVDDGPRHSRRSDHAEIGRAHV